MNKVEDLLSAAGQIKGVNDHAFPSEIEEASTIMSDIRGTGTEISTSINMEPQTTEATLFTRALNWTENKITTTIENTLNRVQQRGSNH